MEIIYEDNHIIAVNKLCGEIVQGYKTGDAPLSELLKVWLKEKYQKPGNVFVGVTHRLDRPVSGVILFARTTKALTRLNEMFRLGQVKKTYWALVKNHPPKEEDELTHWMLRKRSNNSYFFFRDGVHKFQAAGVQADTSVGVGAFGAVLQVSFDGASYFGQL